VHGSFGVKTLCNINVLGVEGERVWREIFGVGGK
jgi:hypothetical protein